LVTEPADLILPDAQSFGTTGLQKLRAARFQLRLTPQSADGLLASYVDVDEFIHQLNTGSSTHIMTYGKVSSPSLYRALRRLADGYPDPKTGEMTAISSALKMKFVQTYIVHPSAPMQTAASRTEQRHFRY
jgi:hypothetical protein